MFFFVYNIETRWLVWYKKLSDVKLYLKNLHHLRKNQTRQIFEDLYSFFSSFKHHASMTHINQTVFSMIRWSKLHRKHIIWSSICRTLNCISETENVFKKRKMFGIYNRYDGCKHAVRSIEPGLIIQYFYDDSRFFFIIKSSVNLFCSTTTTTTNTRIPKSQYKFKITWLHLVFETWLFVFFFSIFAVTYQNIVITL